MELTATGILLGIGWVWFASMRAREKSHETARELCKSMGVELLDDTVALSYMGLKRNDMGRLVLKRVYDFKYLEGEMTLRHGAIILSGYTLESCLVDIHGAGH
ncbi:MAG: DUF3301 domain-containing protein [Magnetococcus sp. THC-1_WYH]